MFKKKKINNNLKEKKDFFIKFSDNKIANIISYIGIIIIFLLLFFIIKKINAQNFEIYENLEKLEFNNLTKEEQKKLELIKKQREELKQKELELKIKKKRDKEKTNILIIGRGGYGNDAPELTDSLILLSYYEKQNYISMLSIPRDLYVDYGLEKNGKKLKGKINALYVMTLEQTQDREKSVKKLEEKIEEITNEKIDYYINIDFRGFIKLIDSIGGVKVNVKKTLIDENYPDNNHGTQTFILRKGKWLLDGETALKYVRSRKNTGGDFGRSERQQQVIKSLKDKILSSSYITSPSNIKKLYQLFNKYISTDIGLIDFIKLTTSIKLKDNLKFYSSTLNTSCIIDNECAKGGFLYYPQRKYFGGQSVLLAGNSSYFNLGNYDIIHQYSDLVFNHPKIFEENYKISIFSKEIDKDLALELKKDLKKFGLKINNLERIGTIPDGFSDEKGGHGEKNINNKLTLYEYNKLKKEHKLQKYKKYSKTKNQIEKEAYNKNTKIIINNVSLNSQTIKFLKKYLHLKDSDIIFHKGGPKYARDKNTRIEILFKR